MYICIYMYVCIYVLWMCFVCLRWHELGNEPVQDEFHPLETHSIMFSISRKHVTYTVKCNFCAENGMIQLAVVVNSTN